MFRRLTFVLLGLALVLVTPAPATSSVTVKEAWAFSATGKLALKGHGFGHGHGMSQYGAAGAARKGLTEAQILKFYYPGTSVAKSTANIAVLITGDTTDGLVVRWQQGLVARDRGTGATMTLPTLARVNNWRFNVENGQTQLQYYRDGVWRAHQLNGRTHLAGDGEFSSSTGRLNLVMPGGAVRPYRGVLRHARPSASSTRRDTVNVVNINAYARGVVPAEMPATWPAEAVQAQAIAARTYALFERQAHLGRHYQICDTTACQVYRGIAGEHPDSDRAVGLTRWQYLAYDGAPAFTQFSASSGGWTSAGSQPYLVSKADPYDDWPGNHVHDWTITIDKAKLQRRYPSLGTVRGLTVTRREGGGDWRGRVELVVVRGSKASTTITGNTMRSIYGLRSTWFTRA